MDIRMPRSFRTTLFAFASLALAALAPAQDLGTKAPKQTCRTPCCTR